MGRIVDVSTLPGAASDGVSATPMTQGETREFAAEYIRIGPGRTWHACVPPGSDCYLFNTRGAASILIGTERHRLPVQSFATIQ